MSLAEANAAALTALTLAPMAYIVLVAFWFLAGKGGYVEEHSLRFIAAASVLVVCALVLLVTLVLLTAYTITQIWAGVG